VSAGPLRGIRILDLTWLLAGAGATRLLAAVDAEVVRVEWVGKLDFVRLGPPAVYRDGETHAPLVYGAGGAAETMPSLNRNGSFNNINAGKRGISLNLGSDRGKEIFRELVKHSDAVLENFSPTAMERMGLPYEALRELKPDLIYVQASGLGRIGSRSRYLSYGPTAQAISGLTFMSGLDDREPAGWGFSYMDHAAAYVVALATVRALHQRERTGEGVYVDMAQAASALFLSGTALLDASANGRESTRVGNGSPFRAAAPHDVYPSAGTDRWIAIAVFSDAEWKRLVTAIGSPDWAVDERFRTMDGRIANREALDRHLAGWTATHDAHDAMHLLQRAGVRAGVCQTNEDKVDNDAQLRERGYFVELDHSEIGPWPVENVPFRMTATPAQVGMNTHRAAPCYGEDTAAVLGELLGMSRADVDALEDDGVIGDGKPRSTADAAS
jgi:crotonobetainyl-CoA:carnitine CoA-transferase CaiB-like acyl-CoA transferase